MMKTRLATLLGSLIAALACGVNTSYAQPGYAQPGMAQPGYGYNGIDPMTGMQPGYPPQGAYSVTPGFSDETGDTDPFMTRFRLDTNHGQGLGWSDGYTSFSGFVPWDFNSACDLVFLDLRGYATHSSDGWMGDGGGANIGFGHRHYFEGIDRYFGFSAWFDLDSGHENTYYGAGLSFETVGKWVDFRLNGYIPLSDPSNQVFNGFIGDPFFRQNNIIVLHRRVTEVQYGGIDGEVGGPVPWFGTQGISAFIGGYFLDASKGDSATGLMGRLELNLNDDVQVGVRASTDRVFGDNVYATVALTLPKGSFHDFFRTQWFRQSNVHDKMDRAVERRYRIPVHTRVRQGLEAAINPIDNQPIFVTHIDSTAPTGGNGTFENPYGAINEFTNSPNVDIIRVVGGNNDRLVRSGPLVLFDNQRLLSSAVAHTVTSTQGTFNFPGFTGGPLPVLRNNETFVSSVIVLASSNEVSGFGINGLGGDDPLTPAVDPPLHNGIVSQPGAITGTPESVLIYGERLSFDINQNEFTNNSNAVLITHIGSGNGYLTDNTAVGNGNLSGRGFSVTATLASDLDLHITDNEVSNFQGEDFDQNDILDFGEDQDGDGLLTPGNGIEVIARLGSVITGSVTGNTITANETGLRFISEFGSAIGTTAEPFLIADNLINLNVGQNTGAHVTVDASSMIADWVENILQDNEGTQLLVDVSNSGEIAFDLIDNEFRRESNGTVGVGVTGNSNAQITMRMFGNLFLGGLESSTDPDVPVNPDVAEGFKLIANNSIVDLLFTGDDLIDRDSAETNRFDLNAGAGIMVVLTGTSDGTAVIENAIITSTRDDDDLTNLGEGDGILFATFDVATLHDVRIDGTVSGLIDEDGNDLGNEGDGIRFIASGSSSVTDILIGNTNGDNGDGGHVQANRNGIFFRREENANVDRVSIVDMTILDNDDNGIRLEAQGTSNIDVADFRIEDSLISRNGLTDDDNDTGSGILLTVMSDAGMRVDIFDNDITENFTAGIQLTEQANDQFDRRFITGTWVSNRIVENVGRGILSNAATDNLIVGLDGFSPDGKSLGNIISLNGSTGVQINGPGSQFYTNNIITRNGQLVRGDATQGHGIDIDDAPGAVTPTLEALGYNQIDLQNLLVFQRNLISGNVHDGIEYRNAFTGATLLPVDTGDPALTDFFGRTWHDFGYTVVVDSNEITFNGDFFQNGGRGIDILNSAGLGRSWGIIQAPVIDGGSPFRDSAGTNFIITNNLINSNGGEGIYVVNTASTSQNQSDPTPTADPDRYTDPTHGMNSDGLVGQFLIISPEMEVRVGTPHLRLTIDNNVIMSNGQNVPPDVHGTGLVIRVGTSDGGDPDFSDPGEFASDGNGLFTAGGVISTVTNNVFGGNFGSEVYFESFTSTVDPITTAGTWTDQEFSVTAFESDPLARMDMIFQGNIFEEPQNLSIIPNVPGAFYDNAEAIFKSRLVTAVPPGPFTSATRGRNAQRLSSRVGLPPFVSPDGGIFQYPGEGESTFRLSSGSDLDGFIIDVQPWTDFTDNRGVLGGADQPYGWSIFP